VATEELAPDAGAEKKPAAAAAPPAADQFFDKYLAATGGADRRAEKSAAASKRHAQRVRAASTSPSISNSKAPETAFPSCIVPGGDSITAFDGHSGWLSVPGRPPHIMTPGDTPGARIERRSATFAVSRYVKDQPQWAGATPAETNRLYQRHDALVGQ